MFNWLRSSLMDEAGADGGGGLAVMDSPSFGADSPAPDAGGTSDGDVLDAEFVDQPQESTALTTQTAPPVAVQGQHAYEGGKLTESGKAALAAVRSISPKVANEVQSALAMRDWFRQQFPAGKREISDMRALIQKYGGAEQLQELKGIADYMVSLDRMYDSSDPRFIAEITTTPQQQQSFVGLMPSALEKFEQLSPERFGQQMAKRFAHLMTEARLPTLFTTTSALMNRASAAAAKGDADTGLSFLSEIIEQYNQIHAVVAQIYKASEAAGTTTAVQAQPRAGDERMQQIEQKERSLRQQEWSLAVTQDMPKVYTKAMDAALQNRKLTDDQKSKVAEYYRLRMMAKVNAFKNNGERHIQTGDKDAYMREQLGFYRRAIPEAVNQAISDVLGTKPGPKANGATEPQVVNGAIEVQRAPDFNDIDWVRTAAIPESMKGEHSMAYLVTSGALSRSDLKNGQLYRWKS